MIQIVKAHRTKVIYLKDLVDEHDRYIAVLNKTTYALVVYKGKHSNSFYWFDPTTMEIGSIKNQQEIGSFSTLHNAIAYMLDLRASVFGCTQDEAKNMISF